MTNRETGVDGGVSEPQKDELETGGIVPERLKIGLSGTEVKRHGFTAVLPGEPRSSVMASLDYAFATAVYPEGDIRYDFVEAYRKNCKQAGIRLYNARFDNPNDNEEILNFYIYLYEDDPSVSYRIDDPAHILVTTYYDTLEQCPLPGPPLYRQFIVRNIRTVMRETLLTRNCEQLRETLIDLFPEICSVHVFSNVYIFVQSEAYTSLCSDPKRLAKIRKTVYSTVKKADHDRILTQKELHIRIDNIENYYRIGGYNYFNSDYMFSCPEI